MTLEQLQTKRDEILSRAGVQRAQFGERSVQYSETKDALAVIDAEISKAQVASSTARVSYASFSDD
jgi:hypothetical protein